MLIFKKAKTPFEKVFKGVGHYLSWFFEPLTLAIKKNISKEFFISKAKVFRGLCFFNYCKNMHSSKIFSSFVDMVEHKNIEKKLKESEEKYQDIYENAPFGIFHTTYRGKLLRANPTFARILKYDSPEEIISETNKTSVARRLFVNPENRYELVEKVVNNSGWHTFENFYKCKDGQIIFAQILLRLIKSGPKGEMEGFFVDITEKKKAEETLLESYKYLGAVNRQFSVLLDLNKIIEEKDNKKIVDSIAWSALEASNAKLAVLYEYQEDKKAFRMLSLASRNVLSEEEKSKIFHLTIISSKCQEKVDEIKIMEIENIEECFKEAKLIKLKEKQEIGSFKILSIMSKGELKGILLLGLAEKKNDSVNGDNFYNIFSRYVGFILLDIGVLK